MSKLIVNAFTGILKVIPLVLIVPVLLGANMIFISALQNSNLPEDIKDTVFNVVAISIPLLVIIFLPRLLKRYVTYLFPPPFAGIEDLFSKGEYEKLISMVEKTVEKNPNWETKIVAVAAYAQAGQLEKAERLIRDEIGILELSQDKTNRMAMAQAFGLFAEILISTGKLDEAREPVYRINGFTELDFATHNTLAKFYLFNNQSDNALPHLDQVEKGYTAAGKPVSGYNRALRAWALALKGQHEQSDLLMVEAIKSIPSEHVADLSEAYYFGGFAAQAQGKANAARKAFEKAYELDPRGIHGILAQKELLQ